MRPYSGNAKLGKPSYAQFPDQSPISSAELPARPRISLFPRGEKNAIAFMERSRFAVSWRDGCAAFGFLLVRGSASHD